MVDPKGKQLVDACVRGDPQARERFLAELLPLIYRFELGGREHESAAQDFLAFLFEGDRLFRRLAGYRGDAPLRAYLWGHILPDLMKQFRSVIRRQRLETIELNDAVVAVAESQKICTETLVDIQRAMAGLSIDKRVLIKLLHIEDFELDAAEVRFLADRNSGSIRTVLARVAEARESVRTREGMQQARFEGAESAGQWIRLYERRLRQLEEDMTEADGASPRLMRLRKQHAELQRKLRKREMQRAEYLRAGQSTVVTAPTALIGELLGQQESTTRGQITRVRRELAQRIAQHAHEIAEAR